MKKLMVSLFIILLFAAGSVNAQKKTTDKKVDQVSSVLKDKAKMQTDKIVSALSLDQDQQDKVYAIVLESTIKKDSVIGKSFGKDGSALMDLVNPINEDRDTKIKALLTPDQATQYDAKKTEFTSNQMPSVPSEPTVPPVK